MCECHCHDNYNLDTLVPMVGIVTDIRQETPDVKTFRVNAPEGGKLFEHLPGQLFPRIHQQGLRWDLTPADHCG